MQSSQKPVVSILAVSYNHSKYVRETLESIRNQTYANIELVILDDCSTDNTVQVISDWINEFDVDCKFIAHDQNQGVCKTYNEGLSKCTGKYYFSVSCDDILHLDKVTRQVAFFDTLGEDVGMIYTNADMFFEDNVDRREAFIEFHRKDDLKPSGDIFDELLKGNFIPGMTALIRLEVLNYLGGFDEDLLYEDYDMWLRVANKYQVVYMDAVTVNYRMHEHNLHKSLSSNSKYLDTLFRVLLKYPKNSITQERLIEIAKEIGLERTRLRSSVTELNDKLTFYRKNFSLFKGLYIRLLFVCEYYMRGKSFQLLYRLIVLFGRGGNLLWFKEEVESIKIKNFSEEDYIFGAKGEE